MVEGKTSCLNNNSFIPALTECERWIDFLVKKFNIELKDGYVMTINKTKKNTLGYFKSTGCEDTYINDTDKINNINLNTLNLKISNPYEVLTHEFAHLINENNGVKDCTSNQYHNKRFKEMAEMLLLVVEKTDKRGFAKTSESDAFKTMLEEFKPKEKAFSICQETPENKIKVGSRLRLFMCQCPRENGSIGIKVRCATDLNATCDDCGHKFEEVL